ncbi:MAG: cytochrome c553, partial [Oleiphilaceae bacterium]
MFMTPALKARTAYGSRCLITLWLLAFSCFSYAGMIDKEGMQAWEICAMCHNANGISRMAKFPKLAGQKAAYIERQITDFRAGLRHNDGGQMQSIVGEVAQEDIAQIAAYFSLLPNDRLENTEHELDEIQTKKLSQGQLLFQ